MATVLRWLTLFLMVSALAAIVALLIADAREQLHLSELHRRAGALAFMFIGASYISVQVSHRRPWLEIFKPVLLGVAFLFWGWEQFLASSPWVTAMDAVVVLIFVADLSLIILERLKQNHHE
jgi:hypothetical protein